MTGIFLLVLTGVAFTRKPLPPKTEPAAPKDFVYYWYTYPMDQYNDYETIADETYEWWLWYGGVLIDTSPTGGTLIARGYQSNNYPHTMFPAAYLYAHFQWNQ